MATLTAHCLVRNEDQFIKYALRSVAPFVDRILVFDTGSTDQTASIITRLQQAFPDKIVFEQKGAADAHRHTALRQEMIERTETDWFMILDGDEIWSRRGMEEARRVIEERQDVVCIIVPFYLCVGDIYHYSWRGRYHMRGRLTHATPRFFKKTAGIHWAGSYNTDQVVDANGKAVFEQQETVFLQHRFWHVSHLQRSSSGEADYSSGGNRADKQRLTYFLIGKKIPEQPPEVFEGMVLRRRSWLSSLWQFFLLLAQKLFKRSLPPRECTRSSENREA